MRTSRQRQRHFFFQFIMLLIPAIDLKDGHCVRLQQGDMDKATEKKLLKAKPLPDVEVLVAGHHGSSYSTGKELLDATTPT